MGLKEGESEDRRVSQAHALGRWGESCAARMLEEAGWTVVGRNVRDGPRELDLIVRCGRLVAFVEVKSRSSWTGLPLESVDWKKRRHLARAAAAWVRRHGQLGERYRFDVVAVVGRPGHQPTLQWFEDAWRIGD